LNKLSATREYRQSRRFFMKKVIVVVFLMLLPSTGVTQVVNTGSTLPRGNFSLGIGPYAGTDSDLGLYILGGYGLGRGLDVGFTLRVDRRPLYFGADLEWQLVGGAPSLSLTTGAHIARNIGLDGTINMMFPIRNVASFYGGLDIDINIREDNVDVPLWLFVGAEIAFSRNFSILFEFDGGLTGSADHQLAFGLNFYF